MGLFDSKRSILKWARDTVSKMSATVANAIRHVFEVKWSYSARRDALAYLELFHTTPRLDPVDMIATDCANSPFHVFKKTDLRAGKNDVEPALNHPIYDLLDNPIPSRPDIDGFTLRYLTHVWWELQGDCYWIIVKDVNNIPREIYPIPSNWVVSAPTISMPYFLVMPQGNTASQSLLVAPENVVWFKTPNIAQPYARGRGRAEAIGDELETDEFASKFAKNVYYNDGTPRSVVIAPGADQDTLNQLKANWMQAYSGVANANRTAFLGSDMKLQLTSTTPRELDYVASREFLRNVPLEHWNIPPEMMGILNNSNRATIETAKYLYMSGPVANRTKRFDSMVNRQLMVMYDQDYVIKSEPDIPEDKEFNLTVANAGWTSGAITRGEWRTKNKMAKLGTPADDQILVQSLNTFQQIDEVASGDAPNETGEDQESGDEDSLPPKVPQDTPEVAPDEPLPVNPDQEVQVNGTPGLDLVKSAKKKVTKYSDDEPRDDHGQWTDGGGSGSTTVDTVDGYDAMAAKYPGVVNPPTEQRDAMRYYSMDGATSMNTYLRDGTLFDDKTKIEDAIKNCSNYIDSNKINEKMTVYRGLQLSSDLKAGDSLKCSGFSSFTTSEEVAQKFVDKSSSHPALLVFDAKSGDPIAAIGNNSAFRGAGSQREMVMNKGGTLKINSVSTKDGVNIYKVSLQ